jgi:hypothetical protein
MGPCETQNADGLALQLELGAELVDDHGDRFAPVALLLQTYNRDAAGKHGCLEIVARHGIDVPDTPVMAVHRGRLDLLGRHVSRDHGALDRTFTHEEIYPPSLSCDADHSLALHATPIAGGTLLHLCMDFDEPAMARWLIARGADVNARAEVDADDFGGDTAPFGTVVTQSGRMREDLELARLLLDHGADPRVRASLRKRLRFVDDK